MKQPYGSTLPLVPTVGDVAFLDDGTLHFCYTNGTWTEISGGGGGTLHQPYDYTPLVMYGDTATTNTSFINLVSRKAPNLLSYTSYTQCFWDLWEFDNTGVAVNSWVGQQFATEAALYAFLAANAVTGGGFYTNNVVGRIYDIVDTEAPSITKMYGMNTHYSLLKGTRAYKKNNVVACDASSINWAGLSAWFEDLCDQEMGFPAHYVWNPADNAEQSLWFPRTSRKLYGLPVTGFSSSISSSGSPRRREWNWGTSSWSDTPVPNTYENNGGKLTTWSILEKSSYDTGWEFTADPTRFVQHFTPNASILQLYRLQRLGSGYNSVFVKPVGIDRIGFNWFDIATYDLVAAYTKKDRTIDIRTINLSGFGATAEERVNDLIWVESSAWWPIHWAIGTINFGSTIQLPRIRFFLRHKTTGLVSTLSDMRVQFSTNMRGAPLKVEIQ